LRYNLLRSACQFLVRHLQLIKVIQITNIFSTNILMFCDNIYENKNLILLLFLKFENIKNRLTFLFFNLDFSVWFVNFFIIRLKNYKRN